MHSVANLVESLIFGDEKVALFVSGLFFEKWLDLSCTIKEIVSPILLLCLEVLNLFSLYVKFIDNVRHLLFKTVYRLLIKNILKYGVASDPEVLG